MKLVIRLFIFFIVFLWCLGIFVEWIIPSTEKLLFALPFLEKTYSLVCHQNENKLITQNHFHTLVCSRCTGIYLGSLFSAFVHIIRKQNIVLPIKYLFIAATPILIDKLFVVLEFYSYSKSVAFVTGLLLGSVGFSYFYSSINQFLIEKRVI